MRQITYVFLFAEAFDLLTTGVIVATGGVELSPLVGHFGWIMTIALKLIVIAGIAWYMEIKGKPAFSKVLDWIFPAVALVPVVWNTIMLVEHYI